MKNQILRPDNFLKELSKKAKEATEQTRALYLKSCDIVNEVKSNERIILFRNETLKISARRHHNVIPKPHYFIRGMEFVTGIRHNNAFDNNSEFWVNVSVKLLIEYDVESTNYHIKEEAHHNLFYGTLVENLIFEEKEYEGNKYGVIEIPHNGSWDTMLEIDNFDDFQKLKGIFIYGCKKIGLDNLASSVTNKNFIELSLEKISISVNWTEDERNKLSDLIQGEINRLKAEENSMRKTILYEAPCFAEMKFKREEYTNLLMVLDDCKNYSETEIRTFMNANRQNFSEFITDIKTEQAFMFRQHRGGLTESMETLVTLNSYEGLIEHCKSIMAQYRIILEPSKLKIEPYGGADLRINWESTYVVTLDGYGVIGFINKNINS